MKKTNTAYFNLLSDLSEAFIVPGSPRRKAVKTVTNRKKPFIIQNDDILGAYLGAVLHTIKELGLEQQGSLYRQKDVSRVGLGEFIVFGDTGAFENYDFRVETDKSTFNGWDARKWKVYSLTRHFNKVLKKLNEYARVNCTAPTFVNPLLAPAAKKSGIEVEVEITVEKTSQRPSCCTRCPLSNSSRVFSRPPAFALEDVAVHHRWVKIGYNQYDIHKDAFGTEFIIRENGDVFLIREDRFGNRYLTK